MKTIEDAKKYLREHLNEGTSCPCCNQFVKQYKRTIHSSMAWGLIQLVKLYEREKRYYHTSEISRGHINPAVVSGDFAKLEKWDLIKQRPQHTDDKRTSGFWIPTQAGIDFVKLRAAVPKHIFIYNAKVYDISTEMILITDALGKKFSYSELMSGSWE